MPLYEYECQACRHRFELRQSFSDEPVVTCPKCEGAVRRVLSPSPIIFKGSGFYVTDTRGKDPDSVPAAKPSSEPKLSSEAKPSSEPKPATQAEQKKS